LWSSSNSELEKFYNLEIKLKLNWTDEIITKFNNLRWEITNMVYKLPKIQEEFIPKFESDDQRFSRLEKIKQLTVKRNKKSKKFLYNINELYKKLSISFKKDINNRKIITLDEYINKYKIK